MAGSIKKPINIEILRILQAHTDVQHPMRLKAIGEKLQEVGLTPTRKSITNNIVDLQAAGYPLIYNHGWYYNHEFSAGELNFLIDDVLCANHLPEDQRIAIVAKLKKLGGVYFIPAHETRQAKLTNPAFLDNLQLLHTAIQEGRQISFHYSDYGTDKQLHYRLNEKKRPKLYRVNPYSIGTTNGRYYLVSNVDKYDSLCHFRIDRILDMRLLKKPIKPLSKVVGGENGIVIQEYMATHPNMYSGTPEQYTLKVKKKWINEVFDTFGMDLKFGIEQTDFFDVTVLSDSTSIELWLKKYAGDVELLKGPQVEPDASK